MSRRRSQPLVHVLLLLVATATFATACGDEGPASTDVAKQATTATNSSGDVEDDDAAVVTPTRAAQASGRRLDALVATYAPVSARLNYLVAAETLRQDALDADAGKATIDERTGTVALEIRRMRMLLARVRPKLLASAVGSADEQHVQQLMLESIDARSRAVAFLERELAARADERVGDSVVKGLDDQWAGAWDESLRRAREATTSMQELRASLALEPAREEAIR
jgi:hypothetical protein